MNTNIKSAFVALTAGCVVVPTLASAVEVGTRSTANPRRSSGDVLEEIVITAQKREERLLDVPISAAVLPGEELDRSTDRGVADALNRIPGVISAVSAGTARTANGTGGTVVIRGISPNLGAGVTGYYLDSVPFGYVENSITPDPSGYDLERVEVLRGPQGTLYGVNALIGVIRVLTNDADLNGFEFKGRVSTSSTEHGGENYRGDVAVNVPIIEGKLAARAVVGYADWDGWIDKPFKKDANDARIANYRLKINAQPTDQLSVGLSGWFSRSKSGAPPATADGLNSISLLDEPTKVEYQAYGLKVGYEFPIFTVTSMTSYLDHRLDASADFTPFTPLERISRGRVDTWSWSEELLLNSTHGGPWRWILGGMYRDGTDRVYSKRELFTSPIGSVVVSKSAAVFGELTRSFLDNRFELTGGLRYFKDKKRNWETSRSNFINSVFEPPFLPGGAPNPRAGQYGLFPAVTDEYSKVTPRAVMAWHPNTQATIYASYSEGFRSGLNQFANARALVPEYPSPDPDKLKSYELGAKGSAWDGRLNFDGAVYYLEWLGVQQILGRTIVENPPTILAVYVNANSVSGPGAEFGVSVEAIDGLVLSASAGWNDLQIDSDVINFGTLLYAKGQRINFSPEYSAIVSLDYAFPLGGGGLNGRFSVSGNHMSKMISDRLSATALWYADSVTMARASFAVESQGGWTASLYGDNLTNAEGITHDRLSPRWNTYVRPRTIGVQLEYHY